MKVFAVIKRGSIARIQRAMGLNIAGNTIDELHVELDPQHLHRGYYPKNNPGTNFDLTTATERLIVQA
ncbi:hypothetical protein ACFL11_00955 [Patescibacteria group bacterium]